MVLRGDVSVERLPGSHVLQEFTQYQPEQGIDEARIAPYVTDPSHRKYLENPTFLRYLKMHKVAVGTSGARELVAIGNQLEAEYMPKFKDAAAWAYAEAGLTDTSRSTLDRVRLVSRAEEIWTDALAIEVQMQMSEYSAVYTEMDTQYRLALALTYAPLVKSIIVGNVTDSIRQQTLNETIEIADMVSNEITRYSGVDDREIVNGFTGLSHELNGLSTVLMMDDPRYLPLPATARADTGYFHKEQTHDMSIINQHWGVIKKIIPVEIKSSPTLRARQRYKALIIRGKMHLTTDGHDSRITSEAIKRINEGTATPREVADMDKMATAVRELLRLYQKGYRPEGLALRSLTSFHDVGEVEALHPELSRLPADNK